MLAHAVHLADGGAGLEQRLVHRLLVRQADAFGRQRKQCGAAAGEKEDHPVALVQAADQFQHATGDALAGVVGHRMGGFHHLDATALRAVAVRRHYQALISPRQCFSTTSAMAPAALPAPMTMRARCDLPAGGRPAPGRDGRLPPRY